MEKIKLFERIKETSQILGDGNITLNGAADGFSAFGDYYSYSDVVFYAITDGTRYEVGSGQYVLDGSSNAIVRFPFQSTNGNNKVSFPDTSLKEVFATYPGKYSVFTASGLGQLSGPQHSGLAFWATENILDYDSNITWDKTNKKLNIDGEANVSGNVTVGGNVVVSGTMDIQGDVTFIDSSNVTIWDKQLELASMSGTAQFGDGNVDDAGIVIKSTDTDKKWVWKNSTDAWSTDENVITSLNIQAKSGILDALDMNVLSSQPTHQEGVVFYDQDSHTLTLYNDESDVALQLGQEEFLRVRNNTGATITNGMAVLIDGSHGNAAPTVSGAIATTDLKSQVVGVATHDIEHNSFGYATTYGLVRNIDTSHYSDGDEVFLSDTLIGSGVSTSPTIPSYKVRIGHCVRSHSSNGSILVQLGSPKLGGGDLKLESSLQVSGIPFVTTVASDLAAAVQTDTFLYYDSGANRLYSTSVNVSSGIILEDGVPTPTTNTLYNDGGTLKFNGSQIGSWFISDGKGRNEEITLGQYVHVSGLSGVDTYYNSDTNVLEVNPGVLSGYFDNKIALSITFTQWDLYGQAGEDLEVTDLTSVGIIGLSGVETYSNPNTFQLEINAGSLSGWADGTIVGTGTALVDKIDASGMAVSGWAAYDIDKLYTSGNAVSGWANGTIVGTGMAVSGWAAYNVDDLYTSGNAISGWTRGTITQEIDSLVDGAPSTLNTLNELAAAINDEHNFHQNITNKIDASGMAISGWAAYDIDKLYTSGNAVSGWAWGNLDKLYTSGNAVSGWAEYHIYDLYTSGMAISGWAKAYADAISSAAGMTNWNVSDGAGGSESITQGVTVEWVGRSGIDTYYNSTNNELEINGGSLSGWADGTIVGTGTTLVGKIDASGTAVSGWAAYDIDQLYTSGNAVSGWADGTIVNTGVALANDIGESGMAISGWAAYDIDQLYTSGNAVSGWADGTIVGTGTTLANDIGQSGMAISGWAAGSFGAGAVAAVANGSDDRVATFSSSDALNGEANLTFDGSALGLVGTFTVGVDDTGHDVKFHGATAGSYLEWDESEDRLNLVGGAFVNEAVPANDTPTAEDATVTLDLSLGNYHNISLGNNVTKFEFTNAKRGQRFILRITQNASSAKTVSWTNVDSDTGGTAADLKWADGGTDPIMSTDTGHKDVYGFLCTATGASDNDTKFDGFVIGQDIPN